MIRFAEAFPERTAVPIPRDAVRVTRYREEFEQEMSVEKNQFAVQLQGSLARSDQPDAVEVLTRTPAHIPAQVNHPRQFPLGRYRGG